MSDTERIRESMRQVHAAAARPKAKLPSLPQRKGARSRYRAAAILASAICASGAMLETGMGKVSTVVAAAPAKQSEEVVALGAPEVRLAVSPAVEPQPVLETAQQPAIRTAPKAEPTPDEQLPDVAVVASLGFSMSQPVISDAMLAPEIGASAGPLTTQLDPEPAGVTGIATRGLTAAQDVVAPTVETASIARPETMQIVETAVETSNASSRNLWEETESCVDLLKRDLGGQRILFEAQSSGVPAQQLDAILPQLQAVNACPEAVVHVEGHADRVGNRSMNLILSLERAEAILAALDENAIETSQFRAMAIGDREAATETQDGAANRRVEFVVY